MIQILFVCTGNTCRSPMAEALFRRYAEENGLDVAVRSAGVSTLDGLPLSSNALTTLRRREIHHSGSSRTITLETVEWADFILTMTSGHKRQLLQRYPDAVDKTFTLKEFAYQDERVTADIAELERLYTEMQMKSALGQQLTTGERQRLLDLERKIPDFDIADPFGGSQSVYDSCSREIEQAVLAALRKLRQSP